MKIIVQKSCGLSFLEKKRIEMVLPKVKGKLLDIGCGCNNLVKNYKLRDGIGIGVDVFAWDGTDLVVKDTARLPYEANSFDTITFLACLNHIPNRNAVLKEAFRVLRPGGILLITMIPKTFGVFWHKLFEWMWGEEKKGRNFKDHEEMGIDNKELISMIKNAGFTFNKRVSFLVFNSLFIAKK